jgi:hypothetical protein
MGKKKKSKDPRVRANEIQTHELFGVPGKGRSRKFVDKKKEEDKNKCKEKVEAEDEWEEALHPLCDICGDIADWVHPTIGLRCSFCPPHEVGGSKD